MMVVETKVNFWVLKSHQAKPKKNTLVKITVTFETHAMAVFKTNNVQINKKIHPPWVLWQKEIHEMSWLALFELMVSVEAVLRSNTVYINWKPHFVNGGMKKHQSESIFICMVVSYCFKRGGKKSFFIKSLNTIKTQICKMKTPLGFNKLFFFFFKYDF